MFSIGFPLTAQFLHLFRISGSGLCVGENSIFRKTENEEIYMLVPHICLQIPFKKQIINMVICSCDVSYESQDTYVVLV